MKKTNFPFRVGLITLVTLLGLYKVFMPPITGANARLPKRQDFTRAGIKQNLKDNIRLGLDLKGGSHLVMRVKTEEYLKRLTEDNTRAAQEAAKDAAFDVKEAHPEVSGSNYRVVLTLGDPAKAKDAREAVEKKVELGDNRGWSFSTSGNTVTWSLTGASQRALADDATTQAMRIMESRINALGVAEAVPQSYGSQSSHQILLQMPGVTDPERVKQLIHSESRLELVHVVSPPSPAPHQTYSTKEEATASLSTGGTVPANRRVLEYTERMDPTAGPQEDPNQPKPKKWVVVESPPIIDGSELRNASGIPSRGGGSDDYEIQFSLKKGGADKFGAWTGAHINEYMGVVLNDQVKSIAFIKSQIFDSGEISGKFTKESADDLALTLRSGALPAPIEYLEERTVGPSLGEDSIRAGVRASLVGLALVVLFMLFYYRGSGVNAVVALLLNMVLMLAGLTILGATLTLPGIAGIILTIGMAVDANVLIFERIREEMRTGKTIPSAVEQGFGRAFVTIIDTHVTTTVSSLFLFLFGTGPIRGFAVTLILGLLINLFSAVYVSRTIFIWLLGRKERVESLSI
jgi:preprotein translocase subunit SecD